jgi:hypothetical protein
MDTEPPEFLLERDEGGRSSLSGPGAFLKRYDKTSEGIKNSSSLGCSGDRSGARDESPEGSQAIPMKGYWPSKIRV